MSALKYSMGRPIHWLLTSASAVLIPCSVSWASTAMKPLKPSSKPILSGSPVAAGTGEADALDIARAGRPGGSARGQDESPEGSQNEHERQDGEHDFPLHSLSPPAKLYRKVCRLLLC